ncbi:MAG: CHAD domain-containing protein, partial [Frankiaceae bacterium]|nr:CHAD domain-containing protein [Frankiaceae bacterium]
LRLASGERIAQDAPPAARPPLAPAGGAQRWPARADALGPGPLRDALSALAGIRALGPICDAHSTLTPARLLDGDGKAVVDALIEAADDGGAAGPAASRVPAARLRIDLAAVRGYDAQLRRAERALRPLCVPAPDDGAAPAGAAPAWPVPRPPAVIVEAAAPAPRALAAVLLHHLDAAQANLGGTIADIDTEYLHDLRVAARATRSLLKLLGDALPGQAAAKIGPRWRWVGQLTAPIRDIDVLLLGLDGLDGGVDIEGIEGLSPYRSWLGGRRRTEFARLRRGLGSDEFASLTREWGAALRPIVAAPPAGPAIRELAAARLARARRRALRLAGRVDADSAPEDLHELRKRIKEMRYLQEAFGAAVGGPGGRGEFRALKSLQDHLGRIQDAAVLLESLDSFVAAHPTAPARTVMGLGALADRQRRRRSEARAALLPLLESIAHKG